MADENGRRGWRSECSAIVTGWVQAAMCESRYELESWEETGIMD